MRKAIRRPEGRRYKGGPGRYEGNSMTAGRTFARAGRLLMVAAVMLAGVAGGAWARPAWAQAAGTAAGSTLAPTPGASANWTSAAAASAANAGGLDVAEERKISETVAASGAPSVSVAVVENGKLTYVKAFGKAELDPARAADVNTRYATGSISKQFTVVAILLAAEQGKLSLDDKVSKYFPELTRANEITVRQLLSHTSGYEDYAPQDYMIPVWTKPTTPEEILDEWAKKPLDFDPGTKWQYSNTNFVLAGKIFEKATGEPLVPFLQKNIFGPLGMTTAGDCSVTKTADDAVAYTRYGLGPARPALREGPGWYFAAGELCMSPSDLAKWDIALLQKKFVSAKSYDEFTREVRLANGDYTHYALGLELGALDNIPTIYHGGEVSGFLAYSYLYPTRDAAVIICSNQDGTDLITPLEQEIARWVLEPEKREESAAMANAPRAELDQVQAIVEGLQAGKINRALFTSNANSYFTEAALADFKDSLAPLGKVKSVTRIYAGLRGGMKARAYHVQFETKTVTVSAYVTNDGLYEQFLVIEDF
jgi:CubicO group peptidase (beta-lactamase class C family)